jgi:aryl-alcohol dehydrogenase-like predicted oxidoreductase
MALVSTAWVLQKGCWPILGLNSEKRVVEAVDALKIRFTPEELEYLESAYKPRGVQGGM